MSHRRRKPKREIPAPDPARTTPTVDDGHRSLRWPWLQQIEKPPPLPGQPPSGMNRQQRRVVERQVAAQQRRGQKAFERAVAAEKVAHEVDPADATARITGSAHGEAR